MGCWGKSSWGGNWGSYGGGRSYKKKYIKKSAWKRDDDDNQGGKKAFKFCGNDDWRDGWKKSWKKSWDRKDRDDDNDGGFKGWKFKSCKRWDRDEDDRGGKCGIKKFWKKFDKKPVICEPEPEQPETEDNNAPEITAPAQPFATFTESNPGIVVTDVDAIDPDGDTLVFSLVESSNPESADADLFVVDPATGVLTFAQQLTLDGSADGDAIYEVAVQVSDGDLTDTIELDLIMLTGA